ncbi:GNAT family N-acetyltransferase [Candidatus Leptofilum sp.]|uniref:GNAT family N-acetyltransferase n=1 Tax=Candidatus Leptofilum sp. TaxID=3241576 RepID=UPI003B58E038
MNASKLAENSIEVTDPPAVPGLHFRRFQGESDFPHMVAIFNNCREADKTDWLSSVGDVRADYEHLTNCDPYTDMIFAEVNGEPVGYGRCWWHDLKEEGRVYYLFVRLQPEWRNKGIRRTMMRHLEQRLRQIAKEHPANQEKFLSGWADQGETHWHNLLEREGYKIVRYGFDMVRPSLDNFSYHPIPDGIEVRRGTLAEFRKIWEAANEAFRDHWGMPEWPEESFEAWPKYPTFNPDLWQIAWDEDEVVGGVLNFIDAEENEAFGRKRGYTETIFVRRPWRRRGVAKALITRSFQVLKEAGMEEAALGVDGESPTGAQHLYRQLGFQETNRGVTFRKPL